MNQRISGSSMQAMDLSGQLSYDVQGLNQLRNKARSDEKGSIHAVAQQFEALFTSMMLKSMRAAVPESDLTGSSETRMFQGMFDDQLSQKLATKHGLGIADMLERQLGRQDLLKAGDLPSTPRQLPLQWQPHALPANRAAKVPQNAMPTTAPVVVQPAGSATAAAGKTSTPLADFVNSVIDQARKAAEAIGVAPHVLAAHAALETGWGKRKIIDAAGNDSHNLFGIKAGKGWNGPVANVATTEYENGKAVKKLQQFRVYGSYSEAFDDYARLLKGNQRYEPALNRGSDARGFADALQSGGYATDPDYASKLTRVAGSRTMQRAALLAYAQPV